ILVVSCHGDGPNFFSVFPAGPSMAQSIFQAETAVSKTEWDNVTLLCDYSTSYSKYMLYWYKRPHKGEMTYLIYQYSEGKNNAREGRFSVNFQKEKNSISLTITGLELEDSAVYFCALREAHGEKTGRRSHSKPPDP
uniref:Ig-like domain-containing protein n=1 Tax=Ornithorhynchus anatinus TaxID=9258 RepID=F6ZNG3_ORNAN